MIMNKKELDCFLGCVIMNKRLINLLLSYHVIKQEDRDIYEYGFFVLWFNLLIILCFILLGLLSSNLKFTIGFFIYH